MAIDYKNSALALSKVLKNHYRKVHMHMLNLRLLLEPEETTLQILHLHLWDQEHNNKAVPKLHYLFKQTAAAKSTAALKKPL